MRERRRQRGEGNENGTMVNGERTLKKKESMREEEREEGKEGGEGVGRNRCPRRNIIRSRRGERERMFCYNISASA